MSLHPQAKNFLDFINSFPRADFHTLGTEKAREAYETRPVEWLPPFVDLFKVSNTQIDLDSHTIPLRMYLPLASNDALPVLVFYHGGGMVIGSLDGYDTLCRQLAYQSGSIVVSVDYRLAPENKFPAAVEDAFAALQWTCTHIAGWGGDPNHIVVGGDSAGGNLAAVVSLLATEDANLQLKGQLLIYPATASYADSPSHHECAQGYFLERSTVLWFHKSYIRNDEDRSDFRYAPILAKDLSGLPPAFVLVAGYDPLRDEGIAYAKRMEAHGVPVQLSNYEGQFHPFISLAGILDEGKQAISECAQVLKGFRID